MIIIIQRDITTIKSLCTTHAPTKEQLITLVTVKRMKERRERETEVCVCVWQWIEVWRGDGI
jgi:hypothetical protein